MLRLEVSLDTPDLHLRNSWPFWCWPPPREQTAGTTSVGHTIDGPALEALASGQSLVLLGAGPFPTIPTSFQPACAGRALGNLATVIEDHPLLNRVPHEGWCDWQFAPTLDGGNAVVFNALPVAFAPLLEVVSSFKTIRKQAAVFEYQVGNGRLLVCTLNLSGDDPGMLWFRHALAEYADSASFRPVQALPVELLNELVAGVSAKATRAGTDQGFDERAQIDP